MFGCESVIDRDNGAARSVGEATALPVVRIEIADHESAAVEIHQHRERFILDGPINTDRNRATRAQERYDSESPRRVLPDRRIQSFPDLNRAGFRKRKLLDGRCPRRRQHVKQRFGLWMESHDYCVLALLDMPSS